VVRPVDDLFDLVAGAQFVLLGDPAMHLDLGR